MALPEISTSACDYVVLDVETNGLKSKECDLLSISIFDPNNGGEYNRFLPLDIDSDVYTTDINGIRKKDLRGKKHLTQREINRLFKDFDLENRTILHYGELDRRFVRDYFSRHNLQGFEKLRFFNFKRMICSTGFSDGSLTKDNLCIFFGIDGVSDVHNGIRDCKLEWRLFEKLDGRYILARIVPARGHFGMWQLAALSSDYILPVSYLSTYKNLSRIIDRPYICCDSENIYRLEVSGEDIKRFPANFSGMTVEHLINTMLDVGQADNSEFLSKNSAKNSLLGYMPSSISFVPMVFRGDGTVEAVREEDGKRAQEMNDSTLHMRKQLLPLIEFIKHSIFRDRPITSQELVVNNDIGVLALCDLSSDDTVLEIKTSKCDPERYAEQLYYEARGREAYLLGMEWDVEEVSFTVAKVRTYPGIKPDKRRDRAAGSIKDILAKESIELLRYVSSKEPIGVCCQACGCKWNETYDRVRGGRVVCSVCHPERASRKRRQRNGSAPKKETLVNRAERYAKKVASRSNGKLVVDVRSYTGGKNTVKVRCSDCGNEWSARSDHLLARCYCPKCRRYKQCT